VAQRRREIAAPCLDEAAGERGRVDCDRQHDPGQRQRIACAARAVRQQRRQAGVAFAGHRRVHLAPEHAALDDERRKREQQQQDAQRGRTSLVELRAHDGKEHFGRQHVEIAAQHDRIAEVRDRLDERDEERVRKARAHQRQRDIDERAEPVGAQRLRGLFE
jgi:hypothetical protein